MVRDNQNANENNQIHNRIEIEHSANTTENDDNTTGSGNDNMALPADNHSTPLLIVLVLRHPDEKSKMYFTEAKMLLVMVLGKSSLKKGGGGANKCYFMYMCVGRKW